uniref:Protein kinase domain-containing protein n=1 Tax=Chromera velia CCMP2878 TaxID=1169474 RepID=A0A0G4GXK1_9ALVE|eukprot:Cvel_779.t1-p1 / transcript=Cvel_779.t1 / gene=Cvel_779 / organism=Chromera_velia_CCMP2878 / gene_product=Arsenical pump membrane protein, putative / transcript_product=Arsenical pump membrane protein, putative / location=Cvel_scaffold24:72784-87571(-) / protein_length=1259 / sequence_SO=supercontig / SO=protein_coding / is_pseudo=false
MVGTSASMFGSFCVWPLRMLRCPSLLPLLFALCFLLAREAGAFEFSVRNETYRLVGEGGRTVRGWGGGAEEDGGVSETPFGVVSFLSREARRTRTRRRREYDVIAAEGWPKMGGFGTVFQVKRDSDQKIFALKMVEGDPGDKILSDLVEKELGTMDDIGVKKVPFSMGLEERLSSCPADAVGMVPKGRQYKRPLCMVLEMLSGGELFAKLQELSDGTVGPSFQASHDIRSWLKQSLAALHFIHETSVSYGSDLWALGVAFYELCTGGEFPFLYHGWTKYAKARPEILKQSEKDIRISRAYQIGRNVLNSHGRAFVYEDKEFTFCHQWDMEKSGVEHLAENIVRDMLTYDPSERPPVSEVIKRVGPEFGQTPSDVACDALQSALLAVLLVVFPLRLALPFPWECSFRVEKTQGGEGEKRRVVEQAGTNRIAERPRTCGSVVVTLDFFWPPVVGVVVLVLTGVLRPVDVLGGLRGEDGLRPYGIVVIFLGTAFLCSSLDATGGLAWLAIRLLSLAGDSRRSIFFLVAALAGLLTVATSNDVVILTLTPIILYVSRASGLPAEPAVLVQFAMANIWSMLLFVGNPTNVVLAEAFRLSTIEYSSWMVLPSVVAGIAALVSIYFFNIGELSEHKKPGNADHEGAEGSSESSKRQKEGDTQGMSEDLEETGSSGMIPQTKCQKEGCGATQNLKMKKKKWSCGIIIVDRVGAPFCSALTVACVVTLSVAPSIGWELWHVAAGFAAAQTVYNLFMYVFFPRIWPWRATRLLPLGASVRRLRRVNSETAGGPGGCPSGGESDWSPGGNREGGGDRGREGEGEGERRGAAMGEEGRLRTVETGGGRRGSGGGLMEKGKHCLKIASCGSVRVGPEARRAGEKVGWKDGVQIEVNREGEGEAEGGILRGCWEDEETGRGSGVAREEKRDTEFSVKILDTQSLQVLSGPEKKVETEGVCETEPGDTGTTAVGRLCPFKSIRQSGENKDDTFVRHEAALCQSPAVDAEVDALASVNCAARVPPHRESFEGPLSEGERVEEDRQSECVPPSCKDSKSTTSPRNEFDTVTVSWRELGIGPPSFLGPFVALPWKVLPFVLAMFVLVRALEIAGWVSWIAAVIRDLMETQSPFVIVLLGMLWGVGLANIVNNQPMSILMAGILRRVAMLSYPLGTVCEEVTGRESRSFSGLFFASVAASNLGANLTLVGALAGILWKTVLEDKGISMGYGTFARVSAPPGLVTIAVCALVLGVQAETEWKGIDDARWCRFALSTTAV